ncbi:MAG: serine/threonine protein phosphatase 1 [Francisellaceae bacterium]
MLVNKFDYDSHLINAFYWRIPLQHGHIKMHKAFAINHKGTDYFVGDIHGHYSLLVEQLKQLNFDFKNDRLFAVGDIIDRGNESEKCLELLIEPWFNSTLGNHEHLFLQGFETYSSWELLIDNGGSWLKKWLNKTERLLSWGHLIRIQMPLAITVETQYGNIGVVHADAPETWGVFENRTVEDIHPYIWNRLVVNGISKAKIKGVDAVFHGHNQVDKPFSVNNQLWADTLQKTGILSIMSAEKIMSIINNND